MYQQKLSPDAQGIFNIFPNGAMKMLLATAYDLYTLQHHMALQDQIMRRLKHSDQFQGARHELFVTASCIRAGCDIRHEDETDSFHKHPEFLATHNDTRQVFAVEAKSAHRHGIPDKPESEGSEVDRRAKVFRLLRDALKKKMNLPCMIFIDLNLPPSPGTPVFQTAWFEDLKNDLHKLPSSSPERFDDFNLLSITNYAYHYAQGNALAHHDEPVFMVSPNPRHPLQHLQVIGALQTAVLQFGNLPNQFPIK